MSRVKGVLGSRVLACLPILVLLGLAQCGDDGTKPPPPPNERPTVQILSGGSSSDSAGIDYRVDFTWQGEDPDGAVVAYEYAIDDTITAEAWQRTEQPGKHVDFTATTPVPGADSVMTDWHTFLVRSVDDDSARSLPDSRHFNARTIAPVTRITRPNFSDWDLVQLPPGYRVRWVGEDADSPEGMPIAYEYKLVRLPDGTYPTPNPATYVAQVKVGDNLLAFRPEDPPVTTWLRVSESVRFADLSPIELGEAYVFAVRAVDAAGATDPELTLGRNLFAFACGGDFPPYITVAGPRVVSHSFPTDGDVLVSRVLAGTTMMLSWTGESLDGSALEWNYAYDIPDPEDMTPSDPNGIGGWTGWGGWTQLRVPIEFGADEGGTTHFLYLRGRATDDKRGAERLAVVRFEVQSGITFEKFALVVDDAKFTSISDGAHDAFLDDVFLSRLRDYGEVDHYSIFAGQEGGTQPGVIGLSTMARYQHIIWSGQPASTHTGLSYSLNLGRDNNDQHLQSYVSAGGRLFLFGGLLTGMERADFGYPVPPPGGSFDDKTRMLYYRFFHLRDWIVSSGCEDHTICGSCYRRTSGLIAARSLNPAFPPLELDPAKWNPDELLEGEYRGGTLDWEGSFHLGDGTAEPIPGLDSLYSAVTWDRSMLNACADPSPVSGAICGLRYASTAQDSAAYDTQGRAIIYLFQPYYFKAEQARAAGTAAIDWLVTGR